MNNPFKTHGAFSWSELLTTNVEEAKKFYTTLFNWESEETDMPGGKYTDVKADGEPIGGIIPIPSSAPKGTPPMWNTYITVKDIDAVVKKAEVLGGKVITPIIDAPDVGRFCAIQDPQGAIFSIISYNNKLLDMRG